MLQFVEVLNVFGGWLSAHLWRMSLELAILAGVVLVVICLLRIRSPRFRHLFWCLVLAKPVATFLVASPLSLYWFLMPAPEPSVPEPVPVVTQAPAYVARPPAMSVRRPFYPGPEMAPSVQEPAWKRLNRDGAASLFWVAIATLLGARLLVGCAYVGFLRHTAHLQHEGPLAEMARDASRRLRARRKVRVALSSVAHGPVLAGVLRPVILLPQAMAGALSEDDLRMIVTHEVAHARRWDNLVLLLQRLAEMFLFFHPVVWFCGWIMRREAEAACDDIVVEAYGDSTKYADSLTRVAEMKCGFTRRLLVNTFAAAESNFARRVKRILTGRRGRMTIWLTVPAVIALVVIALVGLPTVAVRDEGGEELSIMKSDTEFGFRHDPMQFVRNDASLQGAVVRNFVFETPKPGDDALIQARIDEILADQRPDGSFGDTAKATGTRLLELLRLGLPHDRPEMDRAVEAILTQTRAGKIGNKGDVELQSGMSIYPLHALCLLGRSDVPEVPKALEWLAGNPGEYVGMDKGCPWCPDVVVQALWAGREIVETGAAMDASFMWIRDNLNEAGALGWKDPMGVLDCAGYADHPIAREVVAKQLPLILRLQRPDGGWGEHSRAVFRSLKRYGFLDELRDKPPLPPDFEVVREIPVPDGGANRLAWDGRRLWTRSGGEAVALSPEDGAVLQRVPMPNADRDENGACGLAWMDGNLVCSQRVPEKRLLQLDPDTGAVEREIPLDRMEWPEGIAVLPDKIVVADGFMCTVTVLDRANPDRQRISGLPAPGPSDLAGQDNSFWSASWMTRGVVYRNSLDRQLLAWGSLPLGGHSITWDGERLWAIDAANKRICALEITERMKKHSKEPPEPAGSRAHLTGLDLTWDKPRMDTFAMTMERVATFLDREADYDSLSVLSGEAFAPGIDPTEACPGKWNRRGAELALPFIADALGLEITPIEVPPVPAWQGDWNRTRAAWAEQRAQAAPALQKALDDGAVILTKGGWEWRPPDHQNVYFFWGVIAEARDDGTFLGGTFHGRLDEPLGFVDTCWAVKPAAPRLTPQEVRIEALRLGLARIRQDALPFSADERLFGLAAMDRWAGQFGHVPFCSDDCGPKAPGCPLSNSGTTCDGAKCAAAYLRENADTFHESVRLHLLDTAQHYDRIGELLDPFTKWEGGYEPIMGDLDKQEAHIPVIQACRDELAAAADALAKALTTQGIPGIPVSGTSDEVSVHAVAIEGFPPGPGRGNGFAAGLASVVGWWGSETDYDTIMGDSGLAFIIQGDAGASIIDGALDVGYWPLARWGCLLFRDFLGSALGHPLRVEEADIEAWRNDPSAYFERHWRRDVQASLTRGQPVLAHVAPWLLILGIDDGVEPSLLGRRAVSDQDRPVQFEGYPCGLVFVGGKIDQLDRLDADLQALQHAVALGRDTLPLPAGKSAGQRTYALWAEVLRDTKQVGQGRWHGNVCLHLGLQRESAVRYLGAMAQRHPEAVARHLSAAADRYEVLLAVLKEADFSGAKLISKEGREDLARYVEGLAALDAQAVDELALALEAAGIELLPVETGPPPNPSRDLSPERLTRLRQWTNLFGADMRSPLAGAERTPVIFELLDLELSLEPLSEDARIIRDAMTKLEPADMVYLERLKGIVDAIARDGLEEADKKDGELVISFPAWEDRQEDIAKRAQALGLWLDRVPLEEAKESEEADSEVVEQAYALLGTPTSNKRRLVELTSEKLTTYKIEVEELEALREHDELGEFAHRIEMLDPTPWYFDRNYGLLVQGIGREKVVGEWHKPGGPLGWNDGNPDDEEKVSQAIRELETWLRGDLDDMAPSLGARDAYKEKQWLVRCLVVYLQDHLQNYYQWYKAEGSKMADEGETRDERVAIEGVPNLAWGSGRECTFAGALEAATSVTQHPLTYSDIMGLTGLAFRVRWSNGDTEPKWCSSCSIGEMPDEQAALERLTGRQFPTDVQFGVENPDKDAIRAKVVASIDAGSPVVAYGSSLDLALVYGYEDGGATLLLTDYSVDELPFRLPADKLGPMQIFLGEVGEPATPRDALLDTLETAVVNWKRERHGGGIASREYWYGEAAIRTWQHDLTNTGALPEETLKAFHHLNKWNYAALKDARSAAVAFLREHAPLLGDEARAALDEAADRYQGELDHLAQWEQRAEKPWQSGSVDAWTDRVRNSEREALTAIRRAEREAIAQIETALAAEGMEVPEVATTVAAKPSEPTKQLEGYRWQPMWITHVGCLKGAADHLGVDVSVPWLFATTGYAFLLNIHEGMCPSGWHVVDVPVRERVAPAGLEVEYLTDVGHAFDRKTDLQTRAWDGVRKAIDAGLPCYGYDLEIGDYYAVFGYDDTGYYYSGPRCNDGKGPLPWDDYGVTNQVGVIYMLSVNRGTPGDTTAVIRDVLALALKQAHGAAGGNELYASGLAGYDQWIRSLETGMAAGFGLAYNAQCYAECRANAVAFLKEAKERLGGEFAPMFDEAISHYEEVERNLRTVAEAFPFFGHKAEHIQDKTRVNSAVDALKAAKAAETEGLHALFRIAEALGAQELPPVAVAAESLPEGPGAATSRTGPSPSERVLRKDNRVWIEGVSKSSRGNPMIGALTSVLSAIGEDVTYEWVMGVSGAAFRTQFSWCPSAPHALVGYNCMDPAMEAVGRSLTWHSAGKPEEVDATKAAIVDSINRGIPVLYTREEGGHIVGYEDNGDSVLVFCPYPPVHSNDYAPYPISKWTWDGAGIIGEKGSVPSERESVLKALQQAVTLAHMPRFLDGDNEIPTGFAAYEKWIRELREGVGEENVNSRMIGNAWTYDCLMDARAAAAKYLRSAAGALSSENRQGLLDAADCYDQASTILRADRDQFIRYPWDLKESDRWTDAMCSAEAEVLAQALELERRAIAAIEATLAAEGGATTLNHG